MTSIAQTILADVPRYWQASNRSLQPATDGEWLSRAEALTALTAAIDGVEPPRPPCARVEKRDG